MFNRFILLTLLCLCLLLTGCDTNTDTPLPTSTPASVSGTEATDSTGLPADTTNSATTPPATENTETTPTTDATEQPPATDPVPIDCKTHYPTWVDQPFPDAYRGASGKYFPIFSFEELWAFYRDELEYDRMPEHAQQFDRAYFNNENALVIGVFSLRGQYMYIEAIEAYKEYDGQIQLVIEHFLPKNYQHSEYDEYVTYIELHGISDATAVNIEILELGNEEPYEDWP